jgi:ribosomal subunit interface protein
VINTIQINGVHTDLDEDVEAYVNKKIGPLDRFVAKKIRQSVMADVKLTQTKAKDKNIRYKCEVLIKLPRETITVHEKAATFLAAIDVCENKLKIQLKKYKEKHGGPRLHRRLLHRIKRRP